MLIFTKKIIIKINLIKKRTKSDHQTNNKKTKGIK